MYKIKSCVDLNLIVYILLTYMAPLTTCECTLFTFFKILFRHRQICFLFLVPHLAPIKSFAITCESSFHGSVFIADNFKIRATVRVCRTYWWSVSGIFRFLHIGRMAVVSSWWQSYSILVKRWRKSGVIWYILTTSSFELPGGATGWLFINFFLSFSWIFSIK